MTAQLMASWTIITCIALRSDILRTGILDGLYHDYHNYGYVLRYKRDIHVATFDAKLIFHFELPNWDVQFDDCEINWRTDMNVTITPCFQFREVLDTVRDIRSDMQVYIQHQIRHIHDLVQDLLIDTADRSKRGLLTQALSRITGLASQSDVQAVRHVLEQIEKGYYHASVLWGQGAKSLTAAFKLEQGRMQNVLDISNDYRQTIRQLQQRYSRWSSAVVMSLMLDHDVSVSS